MELVFQVPKRIKKTDKNKSSNVDQLISATETLSVNVTDCPA